MSVEDGFDGCGPHPNGRPTRIGGRDVRFTDAHTVGRTFDRKVRGALRGEVVNGSAVSDRSTFNLDLVFAPDGIERFADAWGRRVEVEGSPAVNIGIHGGSNHAELSASPFPLSADFHRSCVCLGWAPRASAFKDVFFQQSRQALYHVRMR